MRDPKYSIPIGFKKHALVINIKVGNKKASDMDEVIRAQTNRQTAIDALAMLCIMQFTPTQKTLLNKALNAVRRIK